MAPFLVGHATHPDWRGALALAAAQVEGPLAARAADGAPPPTLGLVYFSDHYAAEAEALHEALRARWPGVAWVGAVGVGVCASGVEYLDEPALALMLAALPVAQFEVFSGARRLQRLASRAAETALVHVDPRTPDAPALIEEMSRRTASGYVFGGLASSRARCVHIADGVWEGGLSGVAFTRAVALVSRVTQGCRPLGPARRITASERHVVLALDGRPALDCLLEDLGLPDLSQPRAALARLRRTLVGLTDDDATTPALARRGAFGDDTRVRHLVGIDPARRAVALAGDAPPGMRAAFCRRDVEAARRDLVRLCSEIRDEVESQAEAEAVSPAESAVAAASGGVRPEGSGTQVAGAVYVSCAGRGGPHFGGPSAELQIVRRALGDVPLVGFFAGGEIAHRHLYGYTGVLTVFLRGRGRGA